jgi:hypothetical protein
MFDGAIIDLKIPKIVIPVGKSVIHHVYGIQTQQYGYYIL